jgi:hypothetical protein
MAPAIAANTSTKTIIVVLFIFHILEVQIVMP